MFAISGILLAMLSGSVVLTALDCAKSAAKGSDSSSSVPKHCGSDRKAVLLEGLVLGERPVLCLTSDLDACLLKSCQYETCLLPLLVLPGFQHCSFCNNRAQYGDAGLSRAWCSNAFSQTRTR